MNSQTIGIFFAVTFFEIPLIILLWLLIKSAWVKINKIRSLTYSEHERKKDKVKILWLSIIIFILFIPMILTIIIVIIPEFLSILPLPLRLFLIFVLFIIYVHLYGCFYAFLQGLRNVVGAGGSAYSVIKQLQVYIYEALDINQEKKNNNTEN
jgi:hypothetical protein